MKRTLLLTYSLVLCLAHSIILAQGWEKKYGEVIDYKGYYALPTKDGGYILAASSMNADLGFYDDMVFIKTDANGDTTWTRKFSDIDVIFGRIIYQTTDGGYILVSTDKNGGRAHLTKLKPNGDTEWRKPIAFTGTEYLFALIWAHSIQQTTDGGFIIAGELAYVGGGSSDAVLIKTNSAGELTWARTFRIAWLRTNNATAAEQTADGGYIVTGSSESGGFIIKTDSNGYETWKKVLIDYSFKDIRQAKKGDGYVVIGNRYQFFAGTRAGACIMKVDNNGETVFTKILGGRDTVVLSSINITNDGGYCIAGNTGPGRPSTEVLLIKTNSDGDTSWTKIYESPYNDWGYSAVQTGDGNYIIGGTTTNSNNKTQASLIRTDKLGNVLTNAIAGNIFHDKNINCHPDADERKLTNAAHWKVKLMPGEKYAVPDSFGNYMLRADTGEYEVDMINTHPYWQVSCPTSSYTVSFDKFYDTLYNQDFGLTTKTDCPMLWVDVATAIVRPCRETVHTIKYCNNGTADATNAYLEFTLDSALSFVSSTIGNPTQNGNVLRFDLGTIKAETCGDFSITTTVACTATMNSSVCVKAILYPNTVCTPPVSPDWDKSSIEVTGKCAGNGIARFVIRNTGKPDEGDMKGSSEYRIYADNAITHTNRFYLKGGDSLIIQMNACGKVMRLEADQRPGHPGRSRPRATVEGCTGCSITPPPPPVATRLAVASDDAAMAVEEDCAIVRTSFDPNEKLVVPSGITNNHYVLPNEELEFRINFQNTGNDTAFRVVLRDTLDLNVLDISSLAPGVSSHPHTFKIIDKGILEWTFENILLPDSTTNEKASHGFVKFKINQVAGLSNGTPIRNTAGIYFDFNVPVITDPVTLTVSDFVPKDNNNYNITIVKETGTGGNTKTKITVAPHPLVASSVVTVSSAQVSVSDELLLNLFDANGKNVRSIIFTGRQTELEKGSLMKGIYFLEIRKGGESIATTKLLVQ